MCFFKRHIASDRYVNTLAPLELSSRQCMAIEEQVLGGQETDRGPGGVLRQVEWGVGRQVDWGVVRQRSLGLGSR